MSANDAAISIRGLSKAYTIRHDGLKRPTFREVVLDKLKRPFRKAPTETFWALKDVSFDVKKGDVVGIIGRNGAGKSTLLKVLSRIVEPTSGAVDLYGRVGSLLEVGTGFHQELTGRENIYLNGAILGMKRAEVRKQFDAIVDFAEVEKFLDTPVKRYSSGMYVRLAFAVAAHLNPEILIVDEVLAVGDAAFQKKCLGKMQDVSHSQGRTVLFVSHTMAAVRRLCTRSVWMSRGVVQSMGRTEEIISSYLQEQSGRSSEKRWDANSRPGTSKCRLCSARVLGPSGQAQDEYSIIDSVQIEMTYELTQEIRGFRSVVRLTTDDGTVAFTSTDSDLERDFRVPGIYRGVCTIPEHLLNEGNYFVTLGADIPLIESLFLEDNVLSFQVVQTGNASARFSERWQGVVCPRLRWALEVLDNPIIEIANEAL